MPGSRQDNWLTDKPIAHRGLHDISAGIVENTPSSVSAAIAGGYGIEVDLQVSGDGEAMLFHDDALGRLTDGDGALASLSAAVLKTVRYKATSDRMVTLGELLDLVAGRSTLVIELKSRFDGDKRLAQRTAEVLAGYRGPVAVMSFDPAVIETFRHAAPDIARGIVAERHYSHHEWDGLSAETKRELAWFLHARRTLPQFIAYGVRDLPAAAPLAARYAFGLPLLTWTVRSEADRATAARYADQMIFEGFRP